MSKASFARMVRLGIAFAVVLAVGFTAGLSVNAQTGAKILANVPLLGDGLDSTPDDAANLTDFWKAWNTLNSRYVITHASSTMPTDKEKVWGAIEGLAQSYGDPYTVFMPPQEAKTFSEDIAGNFGGIGLEIGMDKNNVITAIAPLKGTPAAAAGFKPGDEIISIDGKSTDGISVDEAVNQIRGPKGTSVSFKILRAGKVIPISVTRDTIQVPTIDNSLDAKSGVYTIALYSFTENSDQLFNSALGSFRASGSNKLIIDLRGDPGGYLDAAVSIASHFLPKDAVVVTEDYAGKKENIVHRSAGTDDVPAGTKVAVLIDQGSASASEILSGALQDSHAATLIGTRSFGKGSVQELVNIDGGSLKVTVARWLTPAGHFIMGAGITPDIESDIATDTPAGVDTQKDRAIEFLTTGK